MSAPVAWPVGRHCFLCGYPVWEAFRSAPLSLHSGVGAETTNFRVMITEMLRVNQSTLEQINTLSPLLPPTALTHQPGLETTWSTDRTLHVMSLTPDTHGWVSRDSLEMGA